MLPYAKSIDRVQLQLSQAEQALIGFTEFSRARLEALARTQQETAASLTSRLETLAQTQRETAASLTSRLEALAQTQQETSAQLRGQLEASNETLDHLWTNTDDRLRDLAILATQGLDLSSGIHLVADSVLAASSADHLFPRGTMRDNTRHPRFVHRCEEIFQRKVRHLDLGCAGGGLVWDFLLAGHSSYGVDGSDYSRVEQRAEWRLLWKNLFTADITKPFEFVDPNGASVKFDVITAWEVLEHIHEADLRGFFDNVRINLASDGLFVASIATSPDEDLSRNVVWHVTVRNRDWWLNRIEASGFKIVHNLFVTRDYVRGSGNPRSLGGDWNADLSPENGFHVACQATDSCRS